MSEWFEVLEEAGYPTTCLMIDFESFFNDEVGFKSLSTIEYVKHPEWETLGFGWKVFGPDPEKDSDIFVTCAPRVERQLRTFQDRYGDNLEGVTVMTKNGRFDMLVLLEHYGIEPIYHVDVEDLTRMFDARMSHNLKDVAELFGTRPKGDTNIFFNMHWKDIVADPDLLDGFIDYTAGDIEAQCDIARAVLPNVTNPATELQAARHTLNLFLYPQFVYDDRLASELLLGMQEEIDNAIKDVHEFVMEHSDQSVFTKKEQANLSDEEKVCGLLSGNLSFVKLLQDALPEGQEVPTKPAKRPGKKMEALLGEGMGPALAKDDEGCKWLLEHDDQLVSGLMIARQAVKSWPLHISRVKRMKNQAKASGGLFRIPMKYYGCHTGRWSGDEKVNTNNLGGKGRGKAINKLISQVRHTLTAGGGSKLCIVDSGQIEARKLALVAGQWDLVDAFAQDADPYSIFASDLFQCKVWKWDDKIHVEEYPGQKEKIGLYRGFGKDAILGCLAEGTKVLTKTSWKNIEDIGPLDILWDGHQWITSDGNVNMGVKQCIKVGNVWLTPEHEIWTKAGWTTAAELSINSLKSGTPMENLRLRTLGEGQTEELSPSNAVVPAVRQVLRQETTLSKESLHAVMTVLKRHPGKLRVIRRLLKNPISHAFLTEFVQSLAGAKRNLTADMVKEVLESGPIGSTIEYAFLSIWRDYRDLIMLLWRSTESTTIEDTNLVISDLLLARNKLETRNATCYDILNAGPNKRFRVSDFICSNCGYGMGRDKFYDNCVKNPALRPLFDSGEYDQEFIGKLIKTYRTKYPKIPEFWGKVENAWRRAAKYGETVEVSDGMLEFSRDGSTVLMRLPSGRVMRYRHANVTARDDLRWHYGKLWGGSITENLVQASCRDLLWYWMDRIEEELNVRVVHHVYDEIIVKCPEIDAHDINQGMIDIMCQAPSWCKDMPLSTDDMIVDYYTK